MIIKIRELLDLIEEQSEISKKDLESFIKLLSPLIPHLAEELWQNLGNKTTISLELWPKVDESKINPEIEKQDEALNKSLEDINNIIKILKDKQGKEVNRIYLYVVPKEKNTYNQEFLQKRLNKKVKIFSNNDKNIHDPESKAKKAKPDKPGIYIE